MELVSDIINIKYNDLYKLSTIKINKVNISKLNIYKKNTTEEKYINSINKNTLNKITNIMNIIYKNKGTILTDILLRAYFIKIYSKEIFFYYSSEIETLLYSYANNLVSNFEKMISCLNNLTYDNFSNSLESFILIQDFWNLETKNDEFITFEQEVCELLDIINTNYKKNNSIPTIYINKLFEELKKKINSDSKFLIKFLLENYKKFKITENIIDKYWELIDYGLQNFRNELLIISLLIIKSKLITSNLTLEQRTNINKIIDIDELFNIIKNTTNISYDIIFNKLFTTLSIDNYSQSILEKLKLWFEIIDFE